jgi:Branched-chain amino acid transport protein (AzlD)
MQDSSAALWLTLAVAGTAANEIWRVSGVWLSRGVDPQGSIMLWVKDVSTALVAALIARLLLQPLGSLAFITGGVRLIAFATGIAAYFLSHRSLAIGLACSEAAFFASHWALQD